MLLHRMKTFTDLTLVLVLLRRHCGSLNIPILPVSPHAEESYRQMHSLMGVYAFAQNENIYRFNPVLVASLITAACAGDAIGMMIL